MTAAPPVSVLLPVRDGAVHLPDALASLEAQTFPDFEVVAVNDGSSDATPDILESWAARDPRVRVLHLPPSGIVSALEAGRRLARGRYLARMDADDVSLPERLGAQFALAEATRDVGAVGCRVRYEPRSVVRAGARRYEDWLNAAVTPEDHAREMFVECPLAHPTFFLRADAVEAVGGYRDRGWPEDYDLLLRLWRAGGSVAKVPRVLLHWREAPQRLSRTHPNYAPEAFLRCKVHHLVRSLLAGWGPTGTTDGGRRRLGAAPPRSDRLRPAVIWGAGPVGKALSRELQGAGVTVRAFVEVDPRKVGQEIHGAPVLDTDAGLALEGPLHLGAVGQPGARERIRRTLRDGGKAELRDFVMAA